MKLHYQKYGDQGPPLIILHGLLGSNGNWATLSRHVFSEDFQVFALDQRNHGKSPHTGPFDYHDLAADVRDFMRQQELGSAYLLGHSMGGKTAMQTALEYPETVEALIVADMAPRAYEPAHESLLEAIGNFSPGKYDSRSDIDAELARHVPDKAIRQFVLKNLTRKNGHYAWQMNHEAISESYDDIIRGVNGPRTFDKPALFLTGERSPYVTGDDRAEIESLFPQAEMREISDAGHWLHADNPEQFADAVMQFLKQLA